MFVLFCACDVMNVLSVKKKWKFTKKLIKKKEKRRGLNLEIVGLHLSVIITSHY